ncbi:MAG: cyclic nucleotide-binding domain-containing protein [Deltaproteobacteria bacterium]|nr:cyclic nucleotide-binding domain-containing protein [Deltaproteobacteria bacterium]
MTEEHDHSSGKKVDGLILDKLGQDMVIPAGTRIVTQGETPEFFYIIESGKVKVFRETADGIRTDLTELGGGAYFGEVALVTGQPRTASVEAVEDSHLIKVSKDEFDHLLDHNPQLARHIIHQLSHWLVSGDRRLESEVVHQVKLRQISWFDYVLMVGLSIVLALVVNIYNDNKIPLIHDWGAKGAIPEITLNQALEAYEKNKAIFVDARKSAFYNQEHIKGATNLPLVLFDLMFPLFQFTVAQTEGSQDKTIIVYGGSFSRRFDLELARLLKQKGMGRVAVLSDYRGWSHTFPQEGQKPKEAASLPLGLPGYLEWLPVGIFALILIPPIRRSPYLSAAGRLLLGFIFISFALSKIMRPAVFALNVVDYGMMPSWGVNLWALTLPWAELVVGLFLILGIRTRAAATLIGAMNIIFIVGLVNAIFHHLPINCGCVGEVGEPVNWWKVTKNAGMLVMCVQIFLYDRFFVLDRGGFTLRERKI